MTGLPHLTALGLCCALGNNKKDVWQNTVAGSRNGMRWRHDLLPENNAVVVGEVDGPLPDYTAWPHKYRTRNNQLAALAFSQIATEVAQLKQCYGSERIAVIVGTSTSGIAEGEHALALQMKQQHFPSDYHYHMQELAAPAEFISWLAAVSGPSYTISTACSSSARALISAKTLLQAGLVDAVIVGGVDSLCQLTLRGFSALEAVSGGFCQPFSANRDGINIGEGAALFTLQNSSRGIALLGAGASSDAYHMSAPQPAGLGAISAITKACQQAGITAAQLSYINLHGTATALNDSMESTAIHTLGLTQVPASSSKAMTGHTLGAAGAIEAALCWLMLSDYNPQHYLIPHCWDGIADPQLAQLNLVSPGQCQPAQYCLSSSFAFGGNNVAVILGRTE